MGPFITLLFVTHRHEAEVSLFLAALELLDAAVTRREVVVLEAGPVWGYTRAQAESCRHVWRNDPVVVLHPIDPTCNLAAVSDCSNHGHRRSVVNHSTLTSSGAAGNSTAGRYGDEGTGADAADADAADTIQCPWRYSPASLPVCVCRMPQAGRTIHWHRLASKARALRRVVLHDSMHDLLVCSSLAPAVAAMFQSGRDF